MRHGPRRPYASWTQRRTAPNRALPAPTAAPRCLPRAALAAGGPDAVRIESLARALGVTKGGFYGHFAHRDALLEAMLDTWERESVDEVRDRVEREGGDARAKIQHAGRLAFSSDRLLPIDLAIRDWARRDEAVAERLRRVDNRRMDYARELFAGICSDPEEAEARSLLAFCLAVGNHFLASHHGNRTRADVLSDAADLVLKRPHDRRA